MIVFSSILSHFHNSIWFDIIWFACTETLVDYTNQKPKTLHFQLGKLLCPTCDKLKFRCICPKPLPLQTPAKTSKSTSDLIERTHNASCMSLQNNNDSSSSQTSTNGPRFMSIQWSNVFSNRSSNSTSSNAINTDNSAAVPSSPSSNSTYAYTRSHNDKGSINFLFGIIFASNSIGLKSKLKFNEIELIGSC